MLLKELCECNGAPGGENEVRQRIIAELASMDCTYEVDNIGNVIAHHKGDLGTSRLLFIAHMDEPALMIYDVTESGFLRFKAVGNSVVSRQLSGRNVRIGKGVSGVVGFAPFHMMKITPEQKNRSATHQHIDIGALNRARALQRVQLGDYAIVDSPFVELGKKTYKGKAMKSRLGCYALLELLRSGCKKSFDVVFATMYEVGQRGVEVAAYTQSPDLVVSVGAVGATDVPGSLDGEGRVELGQGVCIAQADAGFAYSRYVVETWCREAEEAGIRHRAIPYASEAAPAGFAALCRTGAVPISLLVPCRNPSSPAGIVKACDLEETVKMLGLIAKKG